MGIIIYSFTAPYYMDKIAYSPKINLDKPGVNPLTYSLVAALREIDISINQSH